MSSSALIGAALALLASVALNAGYVVQHLGSRDAPAVTLRRPVATLRGLLSSPLWLAGGALGLAGWGAHIGALSRAPLSLVQPFAAGGLVLVVPVGRRLLRRPVLRVERAAVALMGGALLVLGLGASASAARTVPVTSVAAYLAGAVLLAGGLLAPGSRRRGPALGAAAGVLYGAADAVTKAATTVAATDAHVGALVPWVVVIAIASSGAFFAFQRALQMGPVVPVIGLMTAATNVVAVAGGLVVFGEPVGTTAGLAVAHGAALLCVGVAAWLLAPAQAELSSGVARRVPDCPPRACRDSFGA